MDKIEELEDGTIIVKNGNGEIVEVQKGRDIMSEKKPKRKPKKKATKKESKTHHYIRNDKDELIWVPKGTNPDTLPKTIWPFSVTTCNLILRRLLEGESLSKICSERGLPPLHVVYSWRTKHAEFDEQIKKARQYRAEYYHDKALDTAESSDRKTIREDKLKVDTYKWAAEKGDPETFGSKGKEGNSGGVTIQIVTGVPQPKQIEGETLEGTKLSDSEESEISE